MNPVARARLPWVVAGILLVLSLLQVYRLVSFPACNSAPIMIPIRVSSTNPAINDASIQHSSPRQTIASNAYDIARHLTTEQLLYVLANRDRMERDFYIGRSYRDLAEALEKRTEQ